MSEIEVKCIANKMTEKLGGNIRFGFGMLMTSFGYVDENANLKT